MKIITTIDEIKKVLKNKQNIGFVPTMGSLHQGHISLIKKAKIQSDIVVVSIFVNPTQFLEGEDFNKYPKQLELDAKICKSERVDFIFAPNINQMYNKDEVTINASKIKGYILEGFHRPGHFDGVLQVVLKLFNIIKPNKAYFGKKDAQQLYLIKKMVKDLFLDIEIIECELIRDNNGLALSSRNVYLSDLEKTKALSISKSLFLAKKLIKKGKFDCKYLKNEMLKVLNIDKLQYIEFVDNDFNKINKIKKNSSIILIAGFVGTTRLIDNIWV